MSRLRIIYAAKTRHSKKLAQGIGNALNIQADNISNNPVLGEADYAVRLSERIKE